MPTQSVLKMGNPQLGQRSLPVEDFATSALAELIQNMHDSMLEKGGIGIAAPQIGSNLRVIIFGFEKSLRYPNEKPVPLTVLINPEIEILTDKMIDGWEGCLSVPGLRGLVPRYQKIRYRGFDFEGNSIERIAEDFHARILQHECDHLDGILFPQRITNLQFFGFEDELPYYKK